MLWRRFNYFRNYYSKAVDGNPNSTVMNDIFVCYRRADSEEVTERICDRIRDHFLSATIFKDVDSIPPGVDFRTHIAEQIQKSKVFLAIIGRDWLTIASEDGKRRIDDTEDPLRIELETALKFNIPIIPVLVRKAVMPRANQLPDTLKPLAYRNAVEVRRDPDFVQDINKLFKSIAEKVEQKKIFVIPQLSNNWLAIVFLALVLGAVPFGFVFFSDYLLQPSKFESKVPVEPEHDIPEGQVAASDNAGVPELIVPYNPNFLGDINIPLPMITEEAVKGDSLNGRVFDYTHYSLVMDERRAMPLYTACNIDREKLIRFQRQPDEWMLDSRIDRDLQRGRGLYSGNVWDRGHLVRRTEVAWGDSEAEAKAASLASFFYSNSTPQYKEFNRGIWTQLEDYYLRELRSEASRLTVFTGPVSKSSDIEYRGSRIPQAFWKIVAIEDPSNKRNIFVYAYVIKQYDIDNRGNIIPFSSTQSNPKIFQVRVADIENLVPLNFGTLRQFDMYGRE